VILIPEFLNLSQSLFTIEVTTLTKTPLEKENNIVLLHDAQEILKKKAIRQDICENIKIQSLISLIKECVGPGSKAPG
jgi:hypothetical protein